MLNSMLGPPCQFQQFRRCRSGFRWRVSDLCSFCRIMKLPRFLPSGDVLESPRQLVHSIELLLHVTKRIFLDPVVCEGWAETGFSSFWLVRPAMVVCCMFLYRDTFPPLFDVYFLRSCSGCSIPVVSRIFSVAALGVLYFWSSG